MGHVALPTTTSRPRPPEPRFLPGEEGGRRQFLACASASCPLLRKLAALESLLVSADLLEFR